MAISWSSWDYSGNNGMRVGIDRTWEAIDHNETAATVTWKIYTQNQYRYADNNHMNLDYNYTGDGSFDFTNDEDGGAVKLRATRTYTYTYGSSSYGTSPGTVKLRASVSSTYNGSTPSKTYTTSIPARPYAAPAAPSSVTNTRVDDTQATVAWTRNVTAGEPYTSIDVQQRTYDGNTWSAYTTVATIAGTATSYGATGLEANKGYQFQVRGRNSVGSSAYAAAAAPLYMTPAAPSDVTASLETGVVIEWTDNAYVLSGVTFTVQRQTDGGGYADVQTGIAQGTNTWTDPTPGGGTVQYRVKAVYSGLSSAYAESNTVITVVAPLAPNDLSPNAIAIDFDYDQTFTWAHRDGGDGAPQSRYRLRYSSDAGGSWTVFADDVASSVSECVIPGGTLDNGSDYVWQVQTQGSAAGGYGPYSASATVSGASTPVIALLEPDSTIEVFPVTVEWSYTQDESHLQTQWSLSLYAGTDTSGTLLETQGAFDDATETDLTYPMQNGESYTLSLFVTSADGIISNTIVHTFAIDLLPPVVVDLVPEFYPCTGTVSLELSPEAVEEGVTVDVSHVTIQRRINGGEWFTLITGLPLSPFPAVSSVLDFTPTVNGLNEYRVIAYAASEVASIQDPVPLSTDGEELWIFLSYGPAFQYILRMRGNPVLGSKTARLRDAQHYLERAVPLLRVGSATDRTVSASAELYWISDCPTGDECEYDSPPLDWEEASLTADIVCYRDYTGRRIFGALSEVSIDQPRIDRASVSYSVKETSYTERTSFGGTP